MGGIQDKDLGKYKRPGIFINEIDNSIIELPVQNVLINLVPGFSKKGPVNRPVYITNRVDFEKIFGSIDNGLERKGSFFHRTCLKMIESGPIWALNLLSTDDTRDLLNWKSVSVGAAFTNGSTQTMPYSRLFNRQDFWERDTESFLDYVNDPTVDTERLLHITNLGEKTITTFIYKSAIGGFDVTAEDWYGGITKVPAYINPKDWMSDYLVSVLVIEGDWSNYDNLSVDTTWGSYFDATGLDKTLIQDFVDEANVTTLAFYDVSLIPYFKDINGRDMYIKTVINNNTDKTGLFCTYYEDLLLDSDYPTGKMDLIGDGLVGDTSTSIDFLSYNESIVETLSYDNTYLDTYDNVFGNYSVALTDSFGGFGSRTAAKTNWYVNLATMSSTGSTLYLINDNQTSTGKTWFSIDVDDANAFADYNQILNVNDIVFFNKAYGGVSANTAYYIEDITQNSTYFTVSATLGGSPINIENSITPSNLYIQRIKTGLGNLTNATFNLNSTAYTFDTGTTNTTIVFDPLEFSNLTSGTGSTGTHGYERYDVLYLSAGQNGDVNILKGTQGDRFSVSTLATKPEFTTDYNDAIILGYNHQYIIYNSTLSAATSYYVVSEYTPVTLNSTGYIPLSGITITGYTSSNINYLKLTFDNTLGTTDLTNYNQLRYRSVYNEMESYLNDGKGVIINHTTGYKHYFENGTYTDYATASNATITVSVGSQDYTNFYSGTTTQNWLVYYLDNEFVMQDTATSRLMTTLAPVDILTTSGASSYAAGVVGKYSDIYLDYYNGIISNGDYGYINNVSTGTTTKIYWKMWLQGTDLYVDFLGDDNLSTTTISDWTGVYSSSFDITSNNSNYKQSLEIESLDVTKLPNLIYEIKVDKVRFSELKKGDFLEAYYDETLYESGGSLFGTDPRKLTRIVSVTIDTTDTSLKVLKTDAPVKITTYTQTDGSTADYQTTVYPQVDTYVSTYKGITLIPFTIHADSIPNGTETRLSSILDVIGKTTNLTKGLVNKNKISWRYLVDSFGLGLASGSKQQYADLCGLKLNCLGFINAPSVKDFKNSVNPSFINDDRTLNTAYLKAGGDETQNPSFLYSFAEGIGRSTVGYFFPYVKIDDNGVPKNVPPASFVATTYMKKHLSSSASIVPWTIAAGISNGRVAGIGSVEMDFSDEDLENLYSMNLNPIVKKRNAGYCINSESTAQVFPYSSLSVIHSREVLIELENSLYDMLLRYQWRFNTSEIRGEIKFRADKICKDLQDRSALYNFRNVIDETNNTNYIIDLQMGVLDTYIEIIKGMGIIVNNITILKKGDIESGGFQ